VRGVLKTRTHSYINFARCRRRGARDQRRSNANASAAGNEAELALCAKLPCKKYFSVYEQPTACIYNVLFAIDTIIRHVYIKRQPVLQLHAPSAAAHYRRKKVKRVEFFNVAMGKNEKQLSRDKRPIAGLVNKKQVFSTCFCI
jgi:hypothetical protein